MSWGAVVADEARRLGNPTYLEDAAWEAYKTGRMNGRYALMSYGEQRKAWVAAVEWMRRVQDAWLELTVPDLIWELRRGTDSVFWPIIHTIDPGENPQINVECPSDLVHHAGSLQPVTRDGYCLTCSYDHMGNTHQGDN